MSFVTAQPEALTAAAGDLQGIGSVLAAQNAASAAPTTDIAPAGADEVSALMAAQFSTYGSMYQAVSARAAAVHEMLVNTLGTNAGSYAATEAANAAAASTPSAGQSALSSIGGVASALGSNSLVTDFGTGASTAMMYIPSSLVPSMIGFLTAGGSSVGAAGSGLGALLGPGGALGALGALGGIGTASSVTAAGPAAAGVAGQATLVNSVGAAPSGAAATAATPVSAAPAAAAPSGGWATAPESSSVAAMPGGIPGMGAGGGRSGFGAPRYGTKPTVMPRPVVAG